MQRLLTVPEVAEILHLHTETVRELTRDGRLKKIVVGCRSVRVDTIDLQDYINANRKEGEDDEIRPDKSLRQR